MKINKMLIAVLAMVAVVLSSCKDDDPTVGIDLSMPAPATYYDAEMSGSKSIAVYWDAKQALSAGATSFTVQLIKKKDGVADVYDNTTSQTFAAVNEKGVPNDKTSFDNLTTGRIFYVRVRANYPRSVFSDWVLAAVSETDPKEARIMVGTGIVDDEVGETSNIAAKVEPATITESTAIASWSTNGFTDSKTDAGFNYTIELFKDKECKELEVSWKLKPNSIKLAKYGTNFIFTGLTPETKYWFRATNTDDESVSEPVEFTTAKSQFKDLPATAAAGDIILFQDFHEFLWGGDLLNEAAGYSNKARSSATAFEKATGNNPVSSEKFYLVEAGTEMGLFNTLGNLIPNTNLKDWGQMSEEANKDKPGILLARPGMLKVGASNYRGAIVTPELKCLTQPATIELTFKTAGYDNNQEVSIELLDGTTKAQQYSYITATSQSLITKVNAGAKGAGWTTHKVEIQNVTSTCRIAIGSAEKGEGSAQHRFYLDDIQIKVLSYGSVAIELIAPVVKVEATPTTITANWEAVSGARGYTVEYKKTADSDWIIAGETGETMFKIEDLDQKTSYDVRVKATAGDSESEYSETKTIETLEITGSVTASLIKATESQLMVNWTANNGDATADIADDWKIQLYKDAACTDLEVSFDITASSKLFSWGSKWPAPQPAFVFSGLDAEKDYWFKVTNTTKVISTTEKYTTTKSYTKEIPATAAAGDVILYEDFSEFLWGSEPVYGCAGYSSNYRTTCTSIDKATGADPLAIDGPDGKKKLYYTVKEGTNMGLFNTLAGAVPTTRLKNWGVVIEKNQVGALLSGVGYLKLGAASECGTIVTPELSCLTGKAKIKVSFDASPYQEAPKMDPLTMKILIIDGASSNKVEKGDAVPGIDATYSGACVNVITGGTTTVAQTFSLSSTYGYAPYSFEISGVTSTSRIAIATDRNGVDGQHRCYVDNIKIEVVAYE